MLNPAVRRRPRVGEPHMANEHVSRLRSFHSYYLRLPQPLQPVADIPRVALAHDGSALSRDFLESVTFMESVYWAAVGVEKLGVRAVARDLRVWVGYHPDDRPAPFTTDEMWPRFRAAVAEMTTLLDDWHAAFRRIIAHVWEAIQEVLRVWGGMHPMEEVCRYADQASATVFRQIKAQVDVVVARLQEQEIMICRMIFQDRLIA